MRRLKNIIIPTRHCEVRSNPLFTEQLCKFLGIVWDCFVPRNDGGYKVLGLNAPPASSILYQSQP
ncbi:MAG: hypothetical protein JWQ57_3049 [Mucilaginibacter sp.]|nr:hypothetical protein [Mucilaginibacter sp.]